MIASIQILILDVKEFVFGGEEKTENTPQLFAIIASFISWCHLNAFSSLEEGKKVKNEISEW